MQRKVAYRVELLRAGKLNQRIPAISVLDQRSDLEQPTEPRPEPGQRRLEILEIGHRQSLVAAYYRRDAILPIFRRQPGVRPMRVCSQ